MSKSERPVAVERARETIKAGAALKNKQPVVFRACDEDAGDEVPTARKGRRRTQPPVHLRSGMPEHSDDAYFTAQAALRAGEAPAVHQAVPPSDYHRGGPRLDAEELRQITDLYVEKYGPILSLDQAAEITKLSKQTLRRKVCEGKFAASVFRGTPLRFITKRLLEEVLG